MRSLNRPLARGLTLIEVLITLIVMSVGMLGVAMLVAVAIRQGHTASLHSHAVFVAESARDRMAANLVGVWTGAYNGTVSALAAAPAGCATGCAPAALASNDRSGLAAELWHLLGPNASLTLACAHTGPTPADLAQSPPYEGVCDLALGWTELTTDGVSEAQTLRWRFLP